jgi:ferredoxin-NADP reductase
MFKRPQLCHAIVNKITSLNDKDAEVIFDVVDSVGFEFIAGQFISLNCGNGLFRAYSISSSSLIKNQVGIIAAVGHDGVGANYIRGLHVGDSVEFVGPSGRFVLPEILADNLIFIVTGTGIAPILAMLAYLNNIKTTSTIKLYFGVRNKSELFKVEQLEKYKNTMQHFDYTLCFSQDVPEDLASVSVKGRVTDVVEMVDNTQYFICGNPYMVADMHSKLLDNGIIHTNIFHEKFTISKKITA